MKEKLINFFKANEYSLKGENVSKEVNGYDVNIKQDSFCSLSCSFGIAVDLNTGDALSRSLSSTVKHVRFIYDGCDLIAQISFLPSEKSLAKVEKKIKSITKILSLNNVKSNGFCPVCGNSIDDNNSHEISTSFRLVRIHKSCDDEFEEKRRVQAKKNEENCTSGKKVGKLLGSILFGAVIGSVIAFMFLFTDTTGGLFVASIAAFVVSVLFGRAIGVKINKSVLIIYIVLGLLFAFLCLFAEANWTTLA